MPHRICEESIAITFSTTCDLECLGDLAIENLVVCVATIVVKMMKRLPLQFWSQCFIELSLARSLDLWDVKVLSSLFSLKNCETVRGGLEIFSRSHGSRFDGHESCGGVCFALRRFLDTKFIDLGFATAEPSVDAFS